MEFRRIEPTGAASKAVEYYWTVKSDDATPVKQKIIPDGFAEIIFHFGDHYKINLDGRWMKQGKKLLAGQITRHFYLENSGVSNILGIKLKPTAVTHLFGISMKDKVDSVIDLAKATDIEIDPANINEFFSELCADYQADHPADRAVEMIFGKKGMVSVASICKELAIGERYLQQLFQKYVGLPPKILREDREVQLHLQGYQGTGAGLGAGGLRSGVLRSVTFYSQFQSVHRRGPERVYFWGKDAGQLFYEDFGFVQWPLMRRD